MAKGVKIGLVAASVGSIFMVLVLASAFVGNPDGNGATDNQALETPGSGGDLNDAAKKEISKKSKEFVGDPDKFVNLIKQAVKNENCGLTESVLASQLKQESGFNPNAGSSAGAQGIAQFMPGTWPSWGRDENNSGDGEHGSPFDPQDAIPAAARFDCALLKSVQDIRGNKMELMLAGYNAGPGAVREFGGVPPFSETQNYVRVILAQAAKWTDTEPTVADPAKADGKVELTDDSTIDTAVAWAVDQIGSMYHFGGDCTDPFSSNVQHHCDCSSLMQQAYLHAGVNLPRTAHEQAKIGREVSIKDIRPGDLVPTVGEDGTRASPGHIAMYVGNGNVVEAPFEGRPVHFFPLKGYHDIVSIRRVVETKS